jgi:small subunit ribosomal protein S21
MLQMARRNHIFAHYRGCQTRVIRESGGAASCDPWGSGVTAASRGGGSSVVEVKLDDVDRIEWALKTFKKKVQRAGVLQDLRRKRHYVKPSEARQQKAAAARRRKRSRG